MVFLIKFCHFYGKSAHFPLLRKKKKKIKFSFWSHYLERHVSFPENKARYFSGLFVRKIGIFFNKYSDTI